MSGTAFLRVEKLKGGGIIAVASRHNKREAQAERGSAGSVDPARSHLNFSLIGAATAADVAQRAKDLMTAAGVVALRKDAVRAIEAVFSLPTGTAIDTRAYFTDCLAWAAGYFGGQVNIVSFDVHLDEAAPHAHALILPLVNGHMNGGRMVGARSKLLDMQSQFHQAVAKRYGLRKATAKLKGEAKHGGAAQVLAHLRETGDTALQSLAWPNIRACIESDPVPFMLALGLESKPVKPAKQFVDYVVSKGRGPRREREQLPAKSVDFQVNEDGPMSIDFQKADSVKSELYPVRDFSQPQRTQSPPQAPESALNQHYLTSLPPPDPDPEQVTRSSGGDIETSQWSVELGEFLSAAPSSSKTPPRAARRPADTLTPTLAKDCPKVQQAFPDAGASPDELEAFGQYDQPEDIEAWAD